MEKLKQLEIVIKERVPNFQIKFKDESKFMKFLGKLLFFNKHFMTNVTTTIGKTVYFPTKKDLNKASSFYILAHEYVHINDYVKNPIIFILGYLFPQNLSIFSIFALLSFFNFNFLYFLLFLLFLLPIPAPYRTWVELRGYSMSGKILLWEGKLKCDSIHNLVDNFINSSYYYMWPFKKYIHKKLDKNIFSSDILKNSNVAYNDVLKIIRK